MRVWVERCAAPAFFVALLSLFRKEILETRRDALNPFAAGVFPALVELGLLSAPRFAVLGTTVLP